MALPTLTYPRGSQGFSKPFSIFQNGSAVNLLAIANRIVRWHFKDTDATKKFIDHATISGTTNEVANFTVPANFFNKKTEYEYGIEVYNGVILIIPSQETGIVKVTEPPGVHTDS